MNTFSATHDTSLCLIRESQDTIMSAHCALKCFPKRNLTRHLRSHTREKPFACESCGKLFGRKYVLPNDPIIINCVASTIAIVSLDTFERVMLRSTTSKHLGPAQQAWPRPFLYPLPPDHPFTLLQGKPFMLSPV